MIRLNGSNAEREADSARRMVSAANGVVTAEAKATFDRALALDKQDVMARFYMGMAADQDGRRAEAEKIWSDLLAKRAAGCTLDRSGPPRFGARCAGGQRGGHGAPAAPGAAARRPMTTTSTPWSSGSPTG